MGGVVAAAAEVDVIEGTAGVLPVEAAAEEMIEETNGAAAEETKGAEAGTEMVKVAREHQQLFRHEDLMNQVVPRRRCHRLILCLHRRSQLVLCLHRRSQLTMRSLRCNHLSLFLNFHGCSKHLSKRLLRHGCSKHLRKRLLRSRDYHGCSDVLNKGTPEAQSRLSLNLLILCSQSHRHNIGHIGQITESDLLYR